ncbi:MAG: BMP family ABC transporter substrate-binding protein [Chloroflexota bacterium]
MKTKLNLLILILTLILGSSACAPAVVENKPAATKVLKVVNLINGTQGDKSFFDSAVRGTVRAQKEFGIQVKSIEAGNDPAKWQSSLEDAAANEDYDVMIVGTNPMRDYLMKIAPKYPDKKFIFYDDEVDYKTCDCKNVYSVMYKQNEGSYLAGLFAGLMSKTGIVGAVGGQDIPVINDFIIGYEQGAIDARADIKVIKQYATGWDDPAKGKELALAMYQQGADIVFQIAGGTGFGIFQAAQEMGMYAIGVDSDQAIAIEETNPQQAKVILTSMMKNVDNSLYRALKLHLEGKLPYGTGEALGVAEGGVGLAKNKFYDAATPADVKAKIEQAEKDLLAGKIKVDTVFK